MAYFLPQTKNKSEQSELCSDVSKPHEKDIFAFLPDGFEPSQHKTTDLYYRTINQNAFNFPKYSP